MTEKESDTQRQDQLRAAQAQTFLIPDNYGVIGAIESMTTVASPLLAGGSIALAGVVIQQSDSLLLPGPVLLILAIAIVALITAVQCGFWARQHEFRPSEIGQWYPTMPAELRWRRIRQDQWRNCLLFAKWANRARLAYAIGIIAIWTSLAIAVLPRASDEQGRWRVAAAVLLAIATMVEVLWTVFGGKGRAKSRPLIIPPERYPRTDDNDPFIMR
jgi:hypothetical protein